MCLKDQTTQLQMEAEILSEAVILTGHFVMEDYEMEGRNAFDLLVE